MRLPSLMVLLFIGVSMAFCHTTYTGYSGAPGRQTCASSCHGSGTGTITVSGFPTSYTPGQAYTVTVSRTGTVNIANFNASARVGTGTANAGTIAAGTLTSVYNVSGETNGVHFASGPQSSGTFSWTAPVAGTGTVRLYLGGHQGSASGPNNAFVQVATEAIPPPAPATNPSPADLATGVEVDPTLSWTAGSGTTSHDVYFGTSNPPAFIGNQAGATYTPGTLAEGTLYYWRIDEQGAGGTTPGSLWQFTTAIFAPPPAPQAVVIQQDQPLMRLYWPPVSGAAGYNVYRAAAIDVSALPVNLIGATPDTSFVDSFGLGNPDVRSFYVVTATTP